MKKSDEKNNPFQINIDWKWAVPILLMLAWKLYLGIVNYTELNTKVEHIIESRFTDSDGALHEQRLSNIESLVEKHETTIQTLQEVLYEMNWTMKEIRDALR